MTPTAAVAAVSTLILLHAVDGATPVACSLNGDATNGGGCRCDSGWVGADCAVLDLLPNPSEKLSSAGGVGSYVADDDFSSWGMSIIEDAAKKGSYHGFVAEFEYGCSLSSWGTNSYVNHLVASSPDGPWKQAKSGRALSVWAHNPKLVYSPKDQKYVMYHIGSGETPSKARNCSRAAARDGGAQAATGGPSSAAPFSIVSTSSLDGPWTAESTVGLASSGGSRLMTLYPGVSNVKASRPPSGGVRVYEKGTNSSALISLENFTSATKSGALAWDACGKLPPLAFADGKPIEKPNVGSQIAFFEIEGEGVAINAGSPCAVEFPPVAGPHFDARGPFTSKSGRVSVSSETNYFELVEPGRSGVRIVGRTQDADGCRGACAVDATCNSYTWDATANAAGQVGGACFVRNDTLWFPNVTAGDKSKLVSGRPWQFDGDNPAPFLDAASGNVSVLYRTDSAVGVGVPQKINGASLIGLATALSWKGPYSLAGNYGGSITNQDYPWDENEDPFLWKNKRGWHALFHANTWSDSRCKHFSVAGHAGRLAYSVDGVEWIYSHTMPYNGTVRYQNGTSAAFARMERPVLIFDAQDNPTHLVNGMQRYADPKTFTLIQTVRHSKERR